MNEQTQQPANLTLGEIGQGFQVVAFAVAALFVVAIIINYRSKASR